MESTVPQLVPGQQPSALSPPPPARRSAVADAPKRKHLELSTDDGPAPAKHTFAPGKQQTAAPTSFVAAQFPFQAPMPGVFPALRPSIVPVPASVVEDPRDGSSSPRTGVAHRFGGLEIADTYGGAANDVRQKSSDSGGVVGNGMEIAQDGEDEQESSGSGYENDSYNGGMARKRVKRMKTAASNAGSHCSAEAEEEDRHDGNGGDEDVGNESAGSLSTCSSSSASASASTSPLRIIVDPLRASLTWQEDEITVYDPDDSDDDGTGVNGIGFKPTPAVARARAFKRRQQLAEYRKREEREARARRNLQRRTRATVTPTTRARAISPPPAPLTGTTAAEYSAVAVSEAVTGKDSAEAPDGHDADGPTSTPAQESTITRLSQTISSPPSSLQQPLPPTPTSAVRRVRFVDTSPVTIRFLEPEPAVITSS